MFCLDTLSSVQAKIQMLTPSCQILTLIHPSFLKSLGLYLMKNQGHEFKNSASEGIHPIVVCDISLVLLRFKNQKRILRGLSRTILGLHR